MLARYHNAVEGAALKRELLKRKPQTGKPAATRTLTEVSSLLRASRIASGGH